MNHILSHNSRHYRYTDIPKHASVQTRTNVCAFVIVCDIIVCDLIVKLQWCVTVESAEITASCLSEDLQDSRYTDFNHLFTKLRIWITLLNLKHELHLTFSTQNQIYNPYEYHINHILCSPNVNHSSPLKSTSE